MRGLRPRHRPIVQSEPLGGREPHIVDKHVRGLGQLEERRARRRPLQVENDASFVAVYIEKIGAHAAMARRAQRTDRIAFRRLDLDHVRPHVAEDLGRYRPQ